ncbi:uncharacterized protein [Dermacentor andersoni]|uniref:uncharacterized protein n=1 Tax=Dermacentor andersoni TaxID=34620 RepID=UPI002155043A|nr:uncharacterized protein LOC126548607 [Dermacentor andersoni]
MTGCSVPGCKNRSESGKPFYAIPFGQSVLERRRRLRWLLRMGRDKPISRGARICEDHFTDDQFEGFQSKRRRRLKYNAVPSIFPSEGQAPIESKPTSNCAQPSLKTEQVVQPHEAPQCDRTQQSDSTVLSTDDSEPGNDGLSDGSSNQTTCTSPSGSATLANIAPSTNLPVQSATVLAPLQTVTVAPVQQQAQTTLLLEDTGAPTPTYSVTYLIPNLGAYKVTSHVAVPASSLLPTVEPQKQAVPVCSQPSAGSPFLPKKPPKTEREMELERRLALEGKRRRKAEMERDELRRSLKRLLVDDQVRALEKGTMRGSSWSRETVQKALQLRVMCGGRVYDYVKSYVVPLPAQRTLQQLVRRMRAADGEQECLFDELVEAADGEQDCLSDEFTEAADDEQECFFDEITISEEDA